MAVDPYGDPASGGTATKDPFGDPAKSAVKTKKASSTSRITGPAALGASMVSGKLGQETEATANQIGQDALGFIEGATAGIPRGLIESFTDFDIPTGSKTGQLVGFFAGPGKVAGAAGRVAEKAVFKGTAKTGGRMATITGKGFLGNTIKESAGRSALKGATEGAVGGALIPGGDKPLDFGRRLITGMTGALMGAPVGAAFGSVSGFMKSRQLTGMADRVRKNLEKIRSRGLGESPSEGPIYDIPGNPRTAPLRSSPVPFNKVADAESGKIRKARISRVEAVRDQKVRRINALKAQSDTDLSHIESSKLELDNLLASNSDEAIQKVKDVGPAWVNAKYKWYGDTIEKIASDMAEKGQTIKLSELSDNLNEILKSRRILIEDPYSTALISTPERNLLRWASKLNDYRKEFNPNTQAYPDAALELKDVIDEVARLKKLGDNRLSGEVNRALAKVLGGTDSPYAQQIADMNQTYSKFVPMRDFIEEVFQPRTENVMPGRRALFNAANQKTSVADRALDVDQVRTLEKLEKELGVPFLSKLRSYGDDFEKLAEHESKLKRMLADQIALTRSNAAAGMRKIRIESQDELALVAQKRARTQAVVDAIENRVKGNLRTAFDQVKVPETIARQMGTAFFAYVLTRTLANAISHKDN